MLDESDWQVEWNVEKAQSGRPSATKMYRCLCVISIIVVTFFYYFYYCSTLLS